MQVFIVSIILKMQKAYLITTSLKEPPKNQITVDVDQLQGWLVFWFSLFCLSFIIGIVFRYSRQYKTSKKAPNLDQIIEMIPSLREIMNLGLSSATITSGISIFHKLFFSDDLTLIKILQYDVIVLVLGIFSVFWASVHSIWNIFK